MVAVVGSRIYPLAALRTLALHAQGLAHPVGAGPAPSPGAVEATIQRMGAVRIDTLQMVHRSQYVALWSRLGAYDPADLDRLVYGDPAAPPGHNSRRFFKYWLHAACIIPWGYFCLPILHQDRLVGRFDPKLERQSGTLRLKALYLEPGINPAEELVSSVAAAMRDFLRFHAATTLVIERSVPADFGPKLLAVL